MKIKFNLDGGNQRGEVANFLQWLQASIHQPKFSQKTAAHLLLHISTVGTLLTLLLLQVDARIVTFKNVYYL